ncbi:MAG: TROVE domain-containing protein, partial [Planctomycetes bacterium]|nr:TROVE domain-containing protein [Planctomycetota bacterium]
NDYKRIEFQILKYQKRYGWSHKDVLRLTHVKPDNQEKDQIFQYITHDKNPHNPALEQIDCYAKITCAEDEKTVLSLVKQAKFPLEMIPTKWHSSNVLSVVIEYIGYKSLIRNLAKFTHKEVFDDHEIVDYVVHKIIDPDIIIKSLIHPVSILSALKIYRSGKGYRSNIEFKPNIEIIQALNKAFSLSFSNVQPTNKRIMLALDVSASMDYGNVLGIPFLTPRDVIAAIAKVTSEVEKKENLVIGAFTYYKTSSDFFSYEDNFIKLSVETIQKISLEELINALKALPFSRTDCSLPMRFALKHRIPIDAFVIYTDNETYYNENSKLTPAQSLQLYNKVMNVNAKLIVVATTATDFSIADPDDHNMLDICGFDSNCPTIISDFIAGKI